MASLKIDTYSVADGSIQSPIDLPPTLDAVMANRDSLPSQSAIALRQKFEFADAGAGTNTLTWVAPFDCEIVATGGYKPAGTGGAGEKVEIKAGSNVISLFDLNTEAAPTQLMSTLVSAYVSVSAGDTISVVQTSAAGDASAVVWFDVM